MNGRESPIMPYRTKSVELNENDVYYRDSGDGEPLVFLHGGATNHLIWWQQAYGLSPEYRCIIPDQPGHGLSRDRSDGPARIFEPEELVALLEHLDLEAATFVGHSMGGWPAAKVAEQCPEHVRAVVLANTPAGLIESDNWTKHIPDVPQMSHAYADSLDPELKFLYDYLSRIGFTSDSGMEFDVRVDPTLINNADIPVALVHGNEDKYFPVSMMERLESMLSESELFVIEGAGHSPYFERPERFNRLISEFLSHH